MMQQKCALIGYASDDGGTVRGAADGPAALRAHGLHRALNALGIAFVDLGNVAASDVLPAVQFTTDELRMKNVARIYTACEALREKVEGVLEQDLFPVILGGDHSLCMGSFAAVSNFYARRGEKVGVIWVDAHSDINTPQTSPSQCFFGMPNSYALGITSGAFTTLQKRQPAIDLENFVFLGLRDVDAPEKAFIRQHNITALTMKDVDILGIAGAVNKAIEIASRGTAGFIVSFDLDVCDSHLVPGTGTPFRGGFNFRESHLTLELLSDSQKMVSFELVELNPSLDKNNETVDLALSLVESALGKSIL